MFWVILAAATARLAPGITSDWFVSTHHSAAWSLFCTRARVTHGSSTSGASSGASSTRPLAGAISRTRHD